MTCMLHNASHSMEQSEPICLHLVQWGCCVTWTLFVNRTVESSLGGCRHGHGGRWRKPKWCRWSWNFTGSSSRMFWLNDCLNREAWADCEFPKGSDASAGHCHCQCKPTCASRRQDSTVHQFGDQLEVMAGRHGDCTPMIAIYSKRWPVNVSVQCPHCGAILGEW